MNYVDRSKSCKEIDINETDFKSPLASTIQDSLDESRETFFFSDSTDTKQNRYEQIINWFEEKRIKMGDPESLKETFFEDKKLKVTKGYTSELPTNSSLLSKRAKKVHSLLCARNLSNQF